MEIGDNVEPIEQVLAEIRPLLRTAEINLGRCNDTQIHRAVFIGARAA